MPGDALTWLTYAGLGVFVGFLSGLLGIGGGAVIVPTLGLVFVAFGFAPGLVMHLALGTSLAAIVVATASGAREHHAHGAVRMDVVRGVAPGVITAGLAAGAVARVAPVAFLKYFFLAFMLYVTAHILFGRPPARSRPMPGRAGPLRRGRAHRRLLRARGRGRGHDLGAVHDHVGRALPVGHRHLRRDRLRRGGLRHGGLRGGRAHGAGAPRLDPGLRVPSRAPGHLGHERPHGARGARGSPTGCPWRP